MALIVGSIIGVGIFNLPTSLAGLRAHHARVDGAHHGRRARARAAVRRAVAAPAADGGPYAYARAAFGNRLGFFNAWSYWITAWAGNAAIAVGWVLYVEVFVNTGHNKLAHGAARARRAVDPGGDQPFRCEEHGLGPGDHHGPQVRGARVHVGRRPLLHQAAPTSRPGTSARRVRSARSAAGWPSRCSAISVWRCAAVAAAKVRNPDRNIPRSTDPGHARDRGRLHALVHRRVRHRAQRRSSAKATAPFSDAVNAMFGGTWAGNVMAIAVIISGFGALNGWTMICAEMPLAAAKDGLFPQRFQRISKKRRARLRHHRLHRAGLDRDGHQLPRLGRRDRCSPRWC